MIKKLITLLLIIQLFIILVPSKQAFGEVTTQRLDGKDRFEVAVNVSKSGWQNGARTVILANYLAFADALSATPLAYKEDAPILLTAPNSLSLETQGEIQRLNPEKIVIVGGTGSVSEAIVSKLNELGIRNVERIGGIDRFEVSFNIAHKLGAVNTAVIANGLNFPDALSIAPFAAKNGFPILLTYADRLPVNIDNAIKQLNISNTIISGGPASVSESIKGFLPNGQRISGKDRYEVSANIVNQLEPNSSKVFIATGMSFADALTGSVLAAIQGASILLTHPTSAPASVKELISNKGLNNFVILGGKASVPDNTFLVLIGQRSALPLESRVIMLDPGHGGKDPGAYKNGYKEVTLNDSFTLKLANHLTKMGATVLFSREPNSNVFVDLDERTAKANNSNAELFISIHHDSNVSGTPRGLSTHYSSYRPAIETQGVYVMSSEVRYPFINEDTANKDFIVSSNGGTKRLSYEGANIAYDSTPSQEAKNSEILAERLARAAQYPGIGISQIYSSNGIKDHNLFVTRWTKMTSVLIELGFISNQDEVKLLANDSVQDARAQAIAEEIKAFLIK